MLMNALLPQHVKYFYYQESYTQRKCRQLSLIETTLPVMPLSAGLISPYSMMLRIMALLLKWRQNSLQVTKKSACVTERIMHYISSLSCHSYDKL